MKKIVSAFSLLFLVLMLQSCQKQAHISPVNSLSESKKVEIRKTLAKGLMAYYPFTGNTLDSSGNGNNVIFNNCTPTADRYGNANGAYLFDGSTNYMQVKNSSTLNPATITVMAVVKINGFYQGTCHGNRIIQKGNSDAVNGEFFLGFDDARYTNGANCFNSFVDEAHQNVYSVYGNTPGLATQAGDFNNYLVKDRWYTFVFTYDGSTAKFYVDGELRDTYLFTAISTKNNQDVFFGRLNNSQYPYWFNGAIDEIRMYNYALTDEQVAVLSGQ